MLVHPPGRCVHEHSSSCHAESAAAPLSAPAADDQTRLVRSQLLQDGASDVQPPSTPAPSAEVPSSSTVQGQGAPEPKAASSSSPEVSEPASAQGTESQPAQPPSTQPSTSPSAPAPLIESSKELSRLPVGLWVDSWLLHSIGLEHSWLAKL